MRCGSFGMFAVCSKMPWSYWDVIAHSIKVIDKLHKEHEASHNLPF